MQQPELLHANPEVVDQLLAFALSVDHVRDIPVDTDHANWPAVSATDGLTHAANGADGAVRSPSP